MPARTMQSEDIQYLKTDGAPALLVRRQPADGPAVLYVHGATFPSALSVAYRFEGRSWMDDLQAHGYDAWAFDFAGYGGSDRYATMDGPQEGEPAGCADPAAKQVGRVVELICAVTGRNAISLIAHSWGSMPAALFATRVPGRIDSLCLFGPVLHREGSEIRPAVRWRLITLEAQLARFRADAPPGHPPVLIEPELELWGPAYLATDPAAHSYAPPAVKVPGGPDADVAAAWSGQLPYNATAVRAPTLVVRGEWDSLCTDADARWLLSRLQHPGRFDAKIARATHLMHLERGRDGLFAAVRNFLDRTVGGPGLPQANR